MRRPLELYLHIPFCARKCEYCDFLSGPANATTCHEYVKQLIKEIIYQSAFCKAYRITTVFVGGGTPSILRTEDLETIMKTVQAHFFLEPSAEITIEVNPGTVTKEKLEAYRKCGINRISIGLQSANDQELKTLGRIHSYDEFLKTYQRVRLAGFSNVNVDLMSALPGQTAASWKTTLKKVTMLKPEHISAYSLMLEEGTPFYEKYHGNPQLLPNEEEEREIYYMTKEFLHDQGYERYEISNYARPGYECRHNLGYWTGVEYLGLGLGASSNIGHFRFQNEPDLQRYQKISMHGENVGEHLRHSLVRLSDKERMEEFMFLGLRMMKGVSGSAFLQRFGQNMWNVYGEVLKKLEENHLIVVESPYVRLSNFGIDISNYVLSEFLL